jgi:drug/metabolite transporter (DMT)-like permease
MHERPQWNAYLALVLILLGIFVTTRRRARPAPGPNLVAERPRSA